MMDKRFVINMVSSLLLGAALISTSLQTTEKIVVNTSKANDMPWFNRMDESVVKADETFGVNASQVGPSSADAPQRVKIIEDLIARKVNAIIIMLNDASVLEPVFKKARDAGIVVLINESPGRPGANWDIEITDNGKLAAEYVEHMAKRMGGKGGYVIYVGSLAVSQHNLQADLLVKCQKEHCLDIYEVIRHTPIVKGVDGSYRTTLDLMKVYPSLKAAVSFGSNGPIGAGRAVKGRRAENKVVVYGTMILSQAASLIKSGDITEGVTYGPASAGYTLAAVANTLLKDEETKPGLEMQSLGKADVGMGRRIIRFRKVLLVNKDNIGSLY